MFTAFERDIAPKNLYFKLNSSLQINYIEHQSSTVKFAGLYAIYKNNICYYVGQSQNLASRLSQHISGKYSTSDKIILFLAKGNGFDTFDEHSKEARRGCLENNEKLLINILNPVENLLTPDDGFYIPENQMFNMFKSLLSDDEIIRDYYSGVIELGNEYITVSSTQDINMTELKSLSFHNKFILDFAEYVGLECARKEFTNGSR